MYPFALFIVGVIWPTLALGNQIVLSNWETFRQNSNTHSYFQGANSPQEIGINDLPGDGIWYLKSYHSTDSEQSFQITIPIERLLCKPTSLLLSIRYFNHLSPLTVWPTLSDSDYVRLNESINVWTTVVLSIDVERAPHILIDGVILPTGHLLFDEIILLFTNGDCDADTEPTSTTSDVITYQTEGTTQTAPIWQTSGTTAVDSTTWSPDQTTTYSPPVTYLPGQCLYPPGNPPETVNEGFKGFLEWQLSCMTSWIVTNGKQGPLDSIPLPDSEFKAGGNTFDFDTTIKNVQISGALNAIEKSQKLITAQTYSINGGNFYTGCNYCDPYYVDFPSISFTGEYALNGTVLSVFPYNAVGEFSIESNYVPYLFGSFRLENGTVIVNDAYISVIYTTNLKTIVNGLPENELSPELYKELTQNVENFLYTQVQHLFANSISQRALELNRVYEQYIRYMFEGVPILEIIKTPIIQRFPNYPTTENWEISSV